MGWQGNVFQVLIVVSGPNFTGFFVYNGAPAKGSLVAAIVAPGTTSDPFGNMVGAVANFGHWSAAGALLNHFGIDLNGDTFLANTSGLTVQHGHSANGAQWFYNNSGEGLGNLTSSIAPAAGTDLASNPYLGGVAVYVAVTGTFIGTYAVTLNDQLQPWGTTVAALTFNNQTHAPNLAPAVTAQAHSSAGCNLNLQSGKTLAGSVGATIQVQDSVSSSTTGGLVDVIAGKLTVILPDGNTYRTERLRLVTTATQQFTLASAVAITGLAVPLGVGSYHVSVYVPFVPSGVIGSSHNLGFSFSGTATGNVNGQCWQQQAANAVQVASLNNGTLASTVPSPTHVAFNGWMNVEADITVTVAGSLNTNITLGVAGDDITTSPGTFLLLTPA